MADRETSHGQFLSLGDDGSTDISCQSIHLLSVKTNGKERIISAFHPEKGDAPGLAKSIMDQFKNLPLTFDQIRTGDIKVINVCADGTNLNPAMVRELGELAERENIEGFKKVLFAHDKSHGFAFEGHENKFNSTELDELCSYGATTQNSSCHFRELVIDTFEPGAIPSLQVLFDVFDLGKAPLPEKLKQAMEVRWLSECNAKVLVYHRFIN